MWRWYGDAIHAKGIHSIPLFVFNVPALGAVGAPFRAPGIKEPWVVNGSMDRGFFLRLFRGVLADHRQANEDGACRL